MRSSNIRKLNIRDVFEELPSLIDIGPGFLIAGATQCLAASSASTGKPSSNGAQSCVPRLSLVLTKTVSLRT